MNLWSVELASQPYDGSVPYGRRVACCLDTLLRTNPDIVHAAARIIASYSWPMYSEGSIRQIACADAYKLWRERTGR